MYKFKTKICKQCKKRKTYESFYLDKNRKVKNGHRMTTCKKCHNIRTHKWKKENVIKVRIHAMNTHYRLAYGLTIKEVNEMKISRKHRCDICNRKHKLFVDHCHKTGKIRGMLFNTCNSAIGLLKEEKRIFISALKYLKLIKNKEKI